MKRRETRRQTSRPNHADHRTHALTAAVALIASAGMAFAQPGPPPGSLPGADPLGGPDVRERDAGEGQRGRSNGFSSRQQRPAYAMAAERASGETRAWMGAIRLLASERVDASLRLTDEQRTDLREAFGVYRQEQQAYVEANRERIEQLAEQGGIDLERAGEAREGRQGRGERGPQREGAPGEAGPRDGKPADAMTGERPAPGERGQRGQRAERPQLTEAQQQARTQLGELMRASPANKTLRSAIGSILSPEQMAHARERIETQRTRMEDGRGARDGQQRPEGREGRGERGPGEGGRQRPSMDELDLPAADD